MAALQQRLGEVQIELQHSTDENEALRVRLFSNVHIFSSTACLLLKESIHLHEGEWLLGFHRTRMEHWSWSWQM